MDLQKLTSCFSSLCVMYFWSADLLCPDCNLVDPGLPAHMSWLLGGMFVFLLLMLTSWEVVEV